MVLRVIAVIVATAVPDAGPMISNFVSVGFSVIELIVPEKWKLCGNWTQKVRMITKN